MLCSMLLFVLLFYLCFMIELLTYEQIELYTRLDCDKTLYHILDKDGVYRLFKSQYSDLINQPYFNN